MMVKMVQDFDEHRRELWQSTMTSTKTSPRTRAEGASNQRVRGMRKLIRDEPKSTQASTTTESRN